jgi:hypothetical protein
MNLGNLGLVQSVPHFVRTFVWKQYSDYGYDLYCNSSVQGSPVSHTENFNLRRAAAARGTRSAPNSRPPRSRARENTAAASGPTACTSV